MQDKLTPRFEVLSMLLCVESQEISIYQEYFIHKAVESDFSISRDQWGSPLFFHIMIITPWWENFFLWTIKTLAYVS
jgi:hypothetical protein